MDYIQSLIIIKEYINQVFGIYYSRDIIECIIKFIVMIVHKFIKIDCHQDRTCIITNDKIYIWGYHSQQILRPTILEYNEHMFAVSQIKQIKCTSECVFCLTNLGNLYMWLHNSFDQLHIEKIHIKTKFVLDGISSIEKISLVKNLYKEYTHDEIYIWRNNSVYKCSINFRFVVIISEIKIQNEIIIKIKHGEHHNIKLTQSGKLYSYGSNTYGQLGLGLNLGYSSFSSHSELSIKIPLENVKKIKCGANHNIALTTNFDIYVWGSNQCGQLGLSGVDYINLPTKLVLRNLTPKSIKCGANHTIILMTNNRLYSFGSNKYNQLGFEDRRPRFTPEQIPLAFPLIKSIYCGSYHTICINMLNEIYVWGPNCNGQLGLGDNPVRKIPTKLELEKNQ